MMDEIERAQFERQLHEILDGLCDASMTSEEFREWRAKLSLTQKEAAYILYKSVRQIGRYESGETLIYDDVANLCSAFERISHMKLTPKSSSAP